MRIKSIQLLNQFKRFKKLTLDLEDNYLKKVVALVGPNGSGKSSVFDGMLALQHPYIGAIGDTGSEPSDYFTPSGDHQYTNKMLNNVVIDFDKGLYKDVYNQKTQDGKPRTIFLFRSPYRMSQKINVEQSAPQPSIEENSAGASSTTAPDSRLEQNYQRLQAYYQKTMNDEDLKPSQAMKKVAGQFNEYLKSVLDLEIIDIGNFSEKGKAQLYFQKSNQESKIAFNFLSAGEKEVVDILLEIFLKRDIYNDTIYIIDEPELHLNTGIQRKLLLVLERMLYEDCQLWVATHSLGFLRALQDELAEKSVVFNFGDIDFSTLR